MTQDTPPKFPVKFYRELNLARPSFSESPACEGCPHSLACMVGTFPVRFLRGHAKDLVLKDLMSKLQLPVFLEESTDPDELERKGFYRVPCLDKKAYLREYTFMPTAVSYNVSNKLFTQPAPLQGWHATYSDRKPASPRLAQQAGVHHGASGRGTTRASSGSRRTGAGSR
jgi:hypothetical protein